MANQPANQHPNGERNVALPDENHPSWRPHDPSVPEFRGRGREDDDRDDRGWRGERGYRDDRGRGGRPTEYRGQGQSGYGAGRDAEDRAYQRQVRQEPAVSAGSFEDRNHDLGVDDRFTGRGGRDSYWQDRGGRDVDRHGRGGRDFGAERRESSRRSQRGERHDERAGSAERHGARDGRGTWSGGGHAERRGGGHGRDEWSGGGHSRDERLGYGGGPGGDEWSHSGHRRDDRPRYRGGSGGDEWSGGYARDERTSGFGRGYGGYPGAAMGTQDAVERAGGLDNHVHRGTGPHRGKGPVGYQRSDDRIREMVCESLADDDEVDASQIEVVVSGGEVTLSGTVETRRAKREAEECVFSVSGVREVQNQLRVRDSRSSIRTSASGSTAMGRLENGKPDAGRPEAGKSELGKSELDVSAQDKKHRA